MTREEFLLKVGVDTSLVASGLRDASKLMADFFGGVMRDAKKSTIHIANEAKSAAQQYGDWWKQALERQRADAIDRARARIAVVEKAEDEYRARLQRKEEGRRRYEEQRERQHGANLAAARQTVTGINAGGFKVSSSRGGEMSRKTALATKQIGSVASAASGVPGGADLGMAITAGFAYQALKFEATRLKMGLGSLALRVAGVVAVVLFAKNRIEKLLEERKAFYQEADNSVLTQERDSEMRLKTVEKYRAAIREHSKLFRQDGAKLLKDVASGDRSISAAAMKAVRDRIYDPKLKQRADIFKAMLDYIANKQAEIDQKKLAAEQKITQLVLQRQNIIENFQRAKEARRKLSLGEAAGMEYELDDAGRAIIPEQKLQSIERAIGRILNQGEIETMRNNLTSALSRSKDAANIEQVLKESGVFGFGDRAMNQIETRALQLRSGMDFLTMDERYPYEKSLVDLDKNMAELLATAQGAGIRIIPVNGR